MPASTLVRVRWSAGVLEFCLKLHSFFIDFGLYFGTLGQPFGARWAQSGTKNQPSGAKMIPMSLWERPGSIQLSLGMLFLRLLMPRWLPKWPKNGPVETPMVPSTIKIPHFSPKGRFGSVLVSFCHFWTIHVIELFFKHLTFFRKIGWRCSNVKLL